MNNIEWRDGTLILLDQTKLPTHVEYLVSLQGMALF